MQHTTRQLVKVPTTLECTKTPRGKCVNLVDVLQRSMAMGNWESEAIESAGSASWRGVFCKRSDFAPSKRASSVAADPALKIALIQPGVLYQPMINSIPSLTTIGSHITRLTGCFSTGHSWNAIGYNKSVLATARKWLDEEEDGGSRGIEAHQPHTERRAKIVYSSSSEVGSGSAAALLTCCDLEYGIREYKSLSTS